VGRSNATPQALDTTVQGRKVLEKSRKEPEDGLVEMARVVWSWAMKPV